MMQEQERDNLRIAVVGLGYVGLPLAVNFAKAGVSVIGFDICQQRIDELKDGKDLTDEVIEEDLVQAPIQYHSNPKILRKANFIIVAVPTPVNQANQPDLDLVRSASRLVGQNMTKGATIVYESTVYPGVTEDICIKIIEEASGLKCKKDWKIGYSPERVNPGDKEHTIDKVIKIVSGIDRESLDRIAKVYSIICRNGVHKAESIKIAEAAKVFENIQRDVNIALVNELSLICHKMGFEAKDVLKAAGTKWNFLKFRPGLVGGHCIGVDPYYLVYKAEELGYHPQVISAGRRINDSMAEFVADEVVRSLIKAGKIVQKTKILVMGLTFKEDVKDYRNSKIALTINKLRGFGITVFGFDPNLTKAEIAKFAVKPQKNLKGYFDAVIIGVPHRQFKDLMPQIRKIFAKKAAVFDIPGCYEEDFKGKKNLAYRAL